MYFVVKLKSSYLQNFYATSSVEFNSNSMYFFKLSDEVAEKRGRQFISIYFVVFIVFILFTELLCHFQYSI